MSWSIVRDRLSSQLLVRSKLGAVRIIWGHEILQMQSLTAKLIFPNLQAYHNNHKGGCWQTAVGDCLFLHV
jgi:hypothetical protein